jgi:hypothetical protein
MRTPDEYTESIFEFLDQARPDQTFVIEKITKAENRTKFIEAVKLYIRSYAYGGGIEFNIDYTKIRKYEIPPEALKALFNYPKT